MFQARAFTMWRIGAPLGRYGTARCSRGGAERDQVAGEHGGIFIVFLDMQTSEALNWRTSRFASDA